MSFIPLARAGSAGIRLSVPWARNIFTLTSAPRPSAKFLSHAFARGSGDNERLRAARAVMYASGAVHGGRKRR